MTSNEFEWIKIAASSFTPLVLLVLGWNINKTLEQSKIENAKDKESKGEWANRFFSQAISFSDAIRDGVLALNSIHQVTEEKLVGWEKRLECLQTEIHEIIPRIQREEWSMETLCEFCPNSKEEVIRNQKYTFDLVAALYKNNGGNLNEIRSSLQLFNTSAMKAHREILG
jgi:hypothetical protein